MPKKSLTKAKGEQTNWKMLLWNSSSHHMFHCSDGSTFKNLEELQRTLLDMSEETFSHHVNVHKNDFSTWVYDIIGDVKLAEDLRHLHSLTAIAKKVKARLTYIKRKVRELEA